MRSSSDGEIMLRELGMNRDAVVAADAGIEIHRGKKSTEGDPS